MDLVTAKCLANILYNENTSYHDTCSITNPHNGCFTYVTNSRLDLIPSIERDVIIIAPQEFKRASVRIIVVEDPFLVFTLLHNKIWMIKHLEPPQVHLNAQVDETAKIGTEGLRFAKCSNGTLIPFRHVGRVLIYGDTWIGPYCHVQRATFGATVIDRGAKLGPHVSVGHGAYIGRNCIVTAGVRFGGHSNLGRDSFVGISAIIRNGIHIAEHTMIGMGSVVVKDIKEPDGIYYGNPAQRHGEWDGGWAS